MMVDEYTYSSLQIFQRETHPSVYKTGGSKEGLSLFGMSIFLDAFILFLCGSHSYLQNILEPMAETPIVTFLLFIRMVSTSSR